MSVAGLASLGPTKKTVSRHQTYALNGAEIHGHSPRDFYKAHTKHYTQSKLKTLNGPHQRRHFLQPLHLHLPLPVSVSSVYLFPVVEVLLVFRLPD